VKVVYVIGPLRAATPYLVEQNIREAEAVALQVWRAGLSAVCVHSSTRFMHGAAPEEVFTWIRSTGRRVLTRPRPRLRGSSGGRVQGLQPGAPGPRCGRRR
jgi:hypothetical protein